MQKKLVEIIRLETGKIRVSDFVEERSRFLQGIADEAMQESDRITSDALRCLDEASAKVCSSQIAMDPSNSKTVFFISC